MNPPTIAERTLRSSPESHIRGGVRALSIERCDWNNPQPCPVNKTGRCGRQHATWASMRSIQLDDLVRATAEDEIVPIIVRGKRVSARSRTADQPS